MLAGIVSTIATQPVYMAKRKVHQVKKMTSKEAMWDWMHQGKHKK
jgi:hypothetical protein